MDIDTKRSVLAAIADLGSDGNIAENTDIRLEDFLQLKDYHNLQDSMKFLILGGRGSGKTHVFKTLIKENGFEHLVGRKTLYNQPGFQNTQCIVGYQLDSAFPFPGRMDDFANDRYASAFWGGCCVIQILHNSVYSDELLEIARQFFPVDFLAVLQKGTALKCSSQWIPFFQSQREAWENFLDAVDVFLYQKNQWLILAYDQLDRITSRYSNLFPYIRTLLSFWFGNLLRWKRLKCKIFLRTDLFSAEALRFPDSSKLKANQIELTWNTASLYRLLIKRMANHRDPSLQQSVCSYLDLVPSLITRTDTLIGNVPTEDDIVIQRFVEVAIGKYMGSSNKKGTTYQWVTNHLQDANGVLSPRSFLKCFASAANSMLESNGASIGLLIDNRILTPTSIQNAVIDVSRYRVTELQEEYPWLSKLKSSLTGQTLLIEHSEFLSCLDVENWKKDSDWMANDGSSLPSDSPEGIMDTLLRLGIIIEAPDKRINMPEIYLHGFGLTRRGGIKKSQ